MKKLFVSVMFVAVTIGAFTSCNKEDDYDDSVGIEVRMRNYDYGNDEVEVFVIDSIGITYFGGDPNVPGSYDYKRYYPDRFYLKINESNNFCIRSELYSMGNCASITCVGSVKGLGNIKTIPSSGWANEVAVQPGYGYVITGSNGYSNKSHNARVYVKDWIVSTDGGIIGAIIKYQSEWNVEE